MKAAFFTEPGPPEALHYGEVDDPIVADGEVLVDVKAVAVNPIDTYIRAGLVKMPRPNPTIIGCDLAGVVLEVGAGVERFKPGHWVWGSNQGILGRQGTFAEKASVAQQWLYPLLGGGDFADAAASALVGITAHLGLFLHGNLKEGQSVVVNGGSGGVGSMVIQMAKNVGARVLATAGNADKLEYCKELGADEAVNYKSDNLVQAIENFADDGIDLWWEIPREPHFDLAIPNLARRGKMILMAGRDARPEFPVGPFYTRDASLLGFAMFNASAEEQQHAANDINNWMAQGKLQVRIDQTLPLAQAAKAHQIQEDNTLHKAGELTGKIVLTP